MLVKLRCPINVATIVYCDNIIAVYMSTNPVGHQRSKHTEIDIHFVREKVAKGQVWVVHLPSSLQITDIFTKGLPKSVFLDFQSSLCVRLPPTTIAGA